METYLRMFCLHRQDDWADLLPMAEFAYNNHHHPLINTTPFFANYGYHPTLMNVPSAGQSGESDEWIRWIHETQEECKRTIKQLQEISKQAYDKWKNENPGFKVGDSVWLEVTNLSMDEPSPKLASKQHSPFKIKDKLSDLTYCLELPTHWRIHNVFHVNILSEAKLDTIPRRQQPVPPPVKVNDKDFGLWRSMSMLDGSEIVSNSRYNGMGFRKNMTLGKTQMVSTLMMVPGYWVKMTMILI